MILGCEFVAFVMCPIRFIETTPNMRDYVKHKFKALKDKLWILKKIRTYFNKGQNKVSPLENVEIINII